MLKLLGLPFYIWISTLGAISNATGWRSPDDPKNPYRWTEQDREVIYDPDTGKEQERP